MTGPIKTGMILTLALFALVQSSIFAEEKESKKSTKWAVVQLNKEYKVIEANELKAFKLNLKKEYKAQLSAWTEAKKAARKAKEKFTDPRPKKPLLKVLAKSLKSREAADKAVAKMVERDKKKAEKRKRKDKPKA